MKTWTEISEERLAGNFAALQRILRDGQVSGGGATCLLAVVKANAYGHGIDPCATVLARAGAEWLGVTDAHEGARVRGVLRAAGIAKAEKTMSLNRDAEHPNPVRYSAEPEILVMSGTMGLAGEAKCVVRNRLTPVMWDAGHIALLAEAARCEGVEGPVRFHLEVDSGMSRQGVALGAGLDTVLQAISAHPSVVLDGVFTHFAATEVVDSKQTAAQQDEFEAAIEQVVASGLRPSWVHVGNSSYIDNDSGSALAWLRQIAERMGARSMVRSGLALYGYLLPIDGLGRSLAAAEVLPVMAWKTRVIAVREVHAGALVGYNGTFVAQRKMKLGLLPVGYADGLRRELSSTNEKAGGWVMIRGQRATIVGRVSMNLTTVDMSGIAAAAEGDEVVLLGDGVSAQDHARLAGTIAYEILCGVKTSE